MSLHDAITNAAQAALEPYLAPELVEKLTADIVARARPDIETALSAFVGFEVGKPTNGRAKAAAAARPRKVRKATSSAPVDGDDGDADNESDHDDDDDSLTVQ